MQSYFEDTKVAFQEKSTKQLRKAYWMFKAIQSPFLTNIGISLVNFGVKYNLPFVKLIVKNTLFEQFCGGETREESMSVVHRLSRHHIGSIFDYAKEGAQKEIAFEETLEEVLENIHFSERTEGIPFVVFKPTGFGNIDLYEKVGNPSYELTDAEKKSWQKVVDRFDKACALAFEKDVMIMIDAEETWMQDSVDQIIAKMMEQYNKKKPIVWNTVQMYRTGRLEILQKELDRAKEVGYVLGYKFVRGAYMEKERKRAEELNYPDPIQPTKQATDDNFNKAIDFVMNNLEYVAAFFGTHNEYSTQLVMDKMKEKNLPNDFYKIYFGQLFGMSDNITYTLGEHQYNACKYLPYGSVKDAVPYLTRRAQENTSVAGQTNRELDLITTELKRRKNKK